MYRNRRSSVSSSKGFTLIELLIVLLIGAICVGVIVAIIVSIAMSTNPSAPKFDPIADVFVSEFLTGVGYEDPVIISHNQKVGAYRCSPLDDDAVKVSVVTGDNERVELVICARRDSDAENGTLFRFRAGEGLEIPAEDVGGDPDNSL